MFKYEKVYINEKTHIYYAKNNYIGVIFLLIVVVVGEGLLYINIQNKYNSFQTEYNEAIAKYNSLKKSYDKLLNEYYNLQEKYNQLKEDYYALLDEYDSLKEKYDSEELLKIGNSLACYYDLLRRELGSQTGTMKFAANLAAHSLRRIYWPAYETEFYQEVGKHSYDAAYEIIINAISLSGANVNQSPTERIKRILAFINSYIHYEYDMQNFFLAPVETLTFKSGDCDDFAILAATLFEAVEIEVAIAEFVNKDPQGSKQYHCMILVHLDKLEGYGYWYYSDLTSWGLSSGKWIIIEPQRTIDRQYDENWFNQWRLISLSPV